MPLIAALPLAVAATVDQIIAMVKNDPTIAVGPDREQIMSIVQRYPDRQNSSSRCRKVCLVLIEAWTSDFDYLNTFKRAFFDANIEAEIIQIPFVHPLGLFPHKLKEIKTAIRMRKAAGQFVIFFPCTEEIFLKDPNWSFVCSHYQSWYGRKTTVIPHVWTQIRPSSVTPLKWTDKPAFRIGFMGTSYPNSLGAKIVSTFPLSVKKSLLRGHHLKRVGALALLNRALALLNRALMNRYDPTLLSLFYINTFPRSETLKVLNIENGMIEKGVIELVDTQFTGSEQEKNRYKRHLEAMTYVICPRGIENFSIRIYEALKYGRIPVIIDTEMVLPTEIDWDRVAIRIPYDRLNDVYDIILNDYRSRSAAEFVARQRAAFSTMSELESMRWLASRLSHLLQFERGRMR